MSLISCPLFTLQPKSYCSKIYSALAAAWLIPRLTLTALLPQAAARISVHITRATNHSEEHPRPGAALLAHQRGMRTVGLSSRALVSTLRKTAVLSAQSASLPGSPGSSKGWLWCRPLGTGKSPCSRALCWEQPTGSAGGTGWLKVGICPPASPSGSASQCPPAESIPPE